jgi:hypothetical protein
MKNNYRVEIPYIGFIKLLDGRIVKNYSSQVDNNVYYLSNSSCTKIVDKENRPQPESVDNLKHEDDLLNSILKRDDDIFNPGLYYYSCSKREMTVLNPFYKNKNIVL